MDRNHSRCCPSLTCQGSGSGPCVLWAARWYHHTLHLQGPQSRAGQWLYPAIPRRQKHYQLGGHTSRAWPVTHKNNTQRNGRVLQATNTSELLLSSSRPLKLLTVLKKAERGESGLAPATFPCYAADNLFCSSGNALPNGGWQRLLFLSVMPGMQLSVISPTETFIKSLKKISVEHSLPPFVCSCLNYLCFLIVLTDSI